MNIVLIGMRGSGKTTVSKLLAKKLNKEFIELDMLHEQRTGISIQNAVKKHGWEYFRDIESKIAQEVSKLNNKIISTGGGVITNASNIEVLKKHGLFVFLNTPVNTLLQRVNIESKRPRLTDKQTVEEELKEVLKLREHLYRDAADLIIDTNGLSPAKIAHKIVLALERRNI